MKRLAFYDAKPYDIEFFNAANKGRFHIKYYESRLNHDTALLADGYDGVVAFVNDTADKTVINQLYDMKTGILALRCAGYNNVDIKEAYGKLRVVRVPAYSPYAVAEHTMALLLSLSRKIHRAYNRTRDHNFSLNGLTGFNLHGKTIGVIGTGQIGRIVIDICKGFGMKVLAYDPFPARGSSTHYVSLEKLFTESDIITLHCPLTEETYHTIRWKTIQQMKDGVVIINTSRGALVESKALLSGLRSGKIAGAGLDVYEEEEDLFFEDFSSRVVQDEVLALLVSMPNVLLTAHQAFLTREALASIADTTLDNLERYFKGKPLQNEICYQCTETMPNNAKCSASSINCRFKKDK